MEEERIKENGICGEASLLRQVPQWPAEPGLLAQVREMGQTDRMDRLLRW